MASLAHVLERLTGRAKNSDPAIRARAACGHFLRRTRAAERIAAATASVSLAWAFALGMAAVLLALDLVLAPGAHARALAALSLGATSATLLAAGLVTGLGRRFSDRWLARRIEERFPVLDGRLLALVSDRRRSPAVDAFAPGLAKDMEKLASVSVPSRARLHRSALLALIATVAATGAVAGYARRAPAQLGRAVQLLDEPDALPAARLLAVRPGTIKVVEGQTAAIEIGYAGEPREVKLLHLPRDGARRAEGREVPLTAVAFGRLAATLPPLIEDGCYQVVVDQERSPVFPIDVVHAPRVIQVAHREELPSYLEQEPREVFGGDVDAIEGTQILVRATTSSEPLRGKIRATWTGEGLIETIPLAVAGARTLEGSFVAKHGGTYKIDYEDATGLKGREGATFTVSVRPDLPPRAEILAPAGDREIPHAGAITVEYEVRDDHGLGSLALHVAVKGGKARKLSLPLKQGARVAKGKVVLAPKQLGLLPGDSMLYYVAAEDLKAPIPNRGASPPYVLVVEEDALLRQVLTGIESHEDEAFRSLEGAPAGAAPESEEELARNLEALRRLECLVNRQIDPSEAGKLDDPLEELGQSDQEDLSKALEDLDLDEEQFLQPPAQACQQCKKIADNSGKCPRCGRVNKCGTCGKPGHGRGCLAPKGDDAKGAKGQKGDPNKGQGAKGERAKGQKGARGPADPDGEGARSFMMRVARKDLVRRYREMLDKRRELLRKLAEQVALGRPISESLAQKLGPDGARLVDALKEMPLMGTPDAAPHQHALDTQKGRLVSGSRPMRIREEIPHDAVELAPRSEESPAPPGAPGATEAPAWDEELPAELRQVVRQYFKTR